MSRTAALVLGLATLFLLAARPALAQAPDLAVRLLNKNTGDLCAEKDNIDLEFVSPAVRRFRIQAVHPAFINTIVSDRWAPDFTSCDMSHDPNYVSKARRETFWETPEYWLTGYTYPGFWRPASVPVRVGDKTVEGLHLVQLWRLYRERAEEVLVVYPPDGYWRARPLPFADLRWTAYGSSFLVGPVEFDQRPFVALKDIVFDPATRRFTLNFARGGSATLTLAGLDQDHIQLDVGFDGAMPGGLPFAAFRSMYATEFNADAAKAAWRRPGADHWDESPILAVPDGEVAEFWAGRTAPSRHNLSAPDMVFGRFSAGEK